MFMVYFQLIRKWTLLVEQLNRRPHFTNSNALYTLECLARTAGATGFNRERNGKKLFAIIFGNEIDTLI